MPRSCTLLWSVFHESLDWGKEKKKKQNRWYVKSKKVLGEFQSSPPPQLGVWYEVIQNLSSSEMNYPTINMGNSVSPMNMLHITGNSLY